MPTKDQKPRVFIASSSEARKSLGLDRAVASAQAANTSITFVPWWDTKWAQLNSVLQTLEEFLSDFNYGIFVFSPDDKIIFRGREQFQPRDNVSFELGLFLSTLGRSRIQVVSPQLPEGQYHFLSDVGEHLTQNKYTCNVNKNGILSINKSSFETSFMKAGVSINEHNTRDVKEQTTPGEYLARHNSLVADFDAVVKKTHRAFNKIAHGAQAIRMHVPGLAIWRSHVKQRNMESELKDIFLYFKKIDDILDIRELSEKQDKNKHSKLSEVWVFSDAPLEFIEQSHGASDLFDPVREVVRTNLENGVKYKYFISKEKDKCRDVNEGMARVFNRLTPDAKNRIKVVKLNDSHFQTFYTIHKIGESIEVYASFFTEDRKDEYFLKVSDKQSHRILKIMRKLEESQDTWLGRMFSI